ncbi:MAG: DinB family protein [Candidatus Dormibacteraeota bacterium]|nr:DinB family protein [Candidatus Dormibacteraeota bacterium]
MAKEKLVAAEDVVVLMAMVPERISDLASGLDDPRLAYRHAPAFPTLKEVIGHLCEAGPAVDALLRHAYLDGQRELPVRASIDPAPEPDLSPPLADLVEGFGRVRRRTVDLLRGLKPGDWKRVVVDPQQGELTLLEVCEQITQHEVGHLVQIRNLIALLPEP